MLQYISSWLDPDLIRVAKKTPDPDPHPCKNPGFATMSLLFFSFYTLGVDMNANTDV